MNHFEWGNKHNFLKYYSARIIKISDFSILWCMIFWLEKVFCSSGDYPSHLCLIMNKYRQPQFSLWNPMWVNKEEMMEDLTASLLWKWWLLISEVQMYICASGVILIKALSQMMRVYQNEILWTSKINMIWPLYLGCLFSELFVYEI